MFLAEQQGLSVGSLTPQPRHDLLDKAAYLLGPSEMISVQVSTNDIRGGTPGAKEGSSSFRYLMRRIYHPLYLVTDVL